MCGAAFHISATGLLASQSADEIECGGKMRNVWAISVKIKIRGARLLRGSRRTDG